MLTYASTRLNVDPNANTVAGDTNNIILINVIGNISPITVNKHRVSYVNSILGSKAINMEISSIDNVLTCLGIKNHIIGTNLRKIYHKRSPFTLGHHIYRQFHHCNAVFTRGRQCKPHILINIAYPRFNNKLSSIAYLKCALCHCSNINTEIILRPYKYHLSNIVFTRERSIRNTVKLNAILCNHIVYRRTNVHGSRRKVKLDRTCNIPCVEHLSTS